MAAEMAASGGTGGVEGPREVVVDVASPRVDTTARPLSLGAVFDAQPGVLVSFLHTTDVLRLLQTCRGMRVLDTPLLWRRLYRRDFVLHQKVQLESKTVSDAATLYREAAYRTSLARKERVLERSMRTQYLRKSPGWATRGALLYFGLAACKDILPLTYITVVALAVAGTTSQLYPAWHVHVPAAIIPIATSLLCATQLVHWGAASFVVWMACRNARQFRRLGQLNVGFCLRFLDVHVRDLVPTVNPGMFAWYPYKDLPATIPVTFWSFLLFTTLLAVNIDSISSSPPVPWTLVMVWAAVFLLAYLTVTVKLHGVGFRFPYQGYDFNMHRLVGYQPLYVVGMLGFPVLGVGMDIGWSTHTLGTFAAGALATGAVYDACLAAAQEWLSLIKSVAVSFGAQSCASRFSRWRLLLYVEQIAGVALAYFAFTAITDQVGLWRYAIVTALVVTAAIVVVLVHNVVLVSDISLEVYDALRQRPGEERLVMNLLLRCTAHDRFRALGDTFRVSPERALDKATAGASKNREPGFLQKHCDASLWTVAMELLRAANATDTTAQL